MVLGKLALIGQGPLRQIILPEGFLQEQIAGVGVIAQDSGNAGLAPVVSIPGRNPVHVQPVGDGFNTFPGKVFPKDAPNDLCLIRLNNEDAVPVAIAQHGPIPRPAFLEILPDAPFLVFAGRQAFLLRVGREDRNHELSVSGKSVDVLLLEVHVDAEDLQLPDGFQQRHRVPRKA